MQPLAPSDPFAHAWSLALQAGMVRPFVQPVPSPALLAVDAPLAWRLAHVLAEATALQQALGQWSSDPLPKSQDVEAALTGLRKGPGGPGWWKKATRSLHRLNVGQWRHTLEAFRAQAHARLKQTRSLHNALLEAQQAVTTAASQPLPAEASEWVFQARLLAQTLATLMERVTVRERLESDLLELANRGLAAVALLETHRGTNDEEAWELARRRMRGDA